MLREVACIILKSNIPILFSCDYLIIIINTFIFWQFLQQHKDTQLHVLKPDLTFYSYVTYFMRSHFNKKKAACLKYEAIPLQSWTGPEGSRSLRFPDFKKIGA